MQQFCFYFLGFSLWKNTEFVNNYVALNLTISVVFSTILGIIVYYVFEKPITNKYKKSVTRQKGTIK
jgi:peptidoglycan/LPS O-acetylase OafA/YrhL